MVRPVLRSYQSRLRFSVTRPSWTMRLSERSSGSSLAPLLSPEPDQLLFIGAHDDPGIGAADEGATLRPGDSI